MIINIKSFCSLFNYNITSIKRSFIFSHKCQSISLSTTVSMMAHVVSDLTQGCDWGKQFWYIIIVCHPSKSSHGGVGMFRYNTFDWLRALWMTFSCYKYNEHLKHIHSQQQEPGIELSENNAKILTLKMFLCNPVVT